LQRCGKQRVLHRILGGREIAEPRITTNTYGARSRSKSSLMGDQPPSFH
jgi:hypothetical protein